MGQYWTSSQRAPARPPPPRHLCFGFLPSMLGAPPADRKHGPPFGRADPRRCFGCRGTSASCDTRAPRTSPTDVHWQRRSGDAPPPHSAGAMGSGVRVAGGRLESPPPSHTPCVWGGGGVGPVQRGWEISRGGEGGDKRHRNSPPAPPHGPTARQPVSLIPPPPPGRRGRGIPAAAAST